MSQWARRRTLLKNLRTQPGRVAAANSAIHARPREEMSAEALGQLRNLMRDLLDGKEPRDFQLDLVQAQVEGRDTVCQAATGMGKTAVAAGPFLLEENFDKVTLLISPLVGLQEEMVRMYADQKRMLEKQEYDVSEKMPHEFRLKNGSVTVPITLHLLTTDTAPC